SGSSTSGSRPGWRASSVRLPAASTSRAPGWSSSCTPHVLCAADSRASLCARRGRRTRVPRGPRRRSPAGYALRTVDEVDQVVVLEGAVGDRQAAAAAVVGQADDDVAVRIIEARRGMGQVVEEDEPGLAAGGA